MSAAARLKDFFSVLGVDEKCSDEELRRAYLSVARATHPDKGGDEEEFKKVQMAYDILSDPEKRRSFEMKTQSRETGIDLEVLILIQKLRQLVNRAPPKRPRDPDLEAHTNHLRPQFFGALTGNTYHKKQNCPETRGISVHLSSHEVANRTPCHKCVTDADKGHVNSFGGGVSFFSKSSSFGSSTFPANVSKDFGADKRGEQISTRFSQGTGERNMKSYFDTAGVPGLLVISQPPSAPIPQTEYFTYYRETMRKKFHSNQSCWSLQNAINFGKEVEQVQQAPSVSEGWVYCEFCAMNSS